MKRNRRGKVRQIFRKGRGIQFNGTIYKMCVTISDKSMRTYWRYNGWACSSLFSSNFNTEAICDFILEAQYSDIPGEKVYIRKNSILKVKIMRSTFGYYSDVDDTKLVSLEYKLP